MKVRKNFLAKIYKYSSFLTDSYVVEIQNRDGISRRVYSYGRNIEESPIADTVEQAKALDSGRYFVDFDFKKRFVEIEDLFEEDFSLKIYHTEEESEDEGIKINVKELIS